MDCFAFILDLSLYMSCACNIQRGVQYWSSWSFGDHDGCWMILLSRDEGKKKNLTLVQSLYLFSLIIVLPIDVEAICAFLQIFHFCFGLCHACSGANFLPARWSLHYCLMLSFQYLGLIRRTPWKQKQWSKTCQKHTPPCNNCKDLTIQLLPLMTCTCLPDCNYQYYVLFKLKF